MNILFASYGAAHVRQILPLLPLFEAAGHKVIPLALTTAVNAYVRAGRAHRRITDYVTVDDELRAIAAPLMARHHNPQAGIAEEESIAYLGASMRDLIHAIGPKAAHERYEKLGLNAFEPQSIARQIIESTQADMIMTTCSPRMERALLASAVAMKRPAICLMALFPLVGMPYLSRPDHGHLLFAGNERFCRQLVAHGRPASSLKIVGNPAFDLLAPSDAQERRARLRARRGIADDAVVILWAEQPEPAENDQWPKKVREQVCALAHTHPAYMPLIRLHPSSQLGQRVVVPDGVLVSGSDEDATDALLTADVVITATSTIGYEAALMGKEVIIVRGSHYDAYADYSEEEGALVIDRIDDLPSALALVTGDGELAQRLRRYRQALPKPGNFAAQTLTTTLEWLASDWPHVRDAKTPISTGRADPYQL